MILQNEDVIKLLIAILVGGLIGAEREYRDKVAGFRTNIFICVGATLFSILSIQIGGSIDPARIAASIVSGVGFLGAGAILRGDGRVVGLTTAATIWLTAALGMGIASGEYLLVGASTIIMLAVLVVFPYVEFLIGRWRDTRTYTIIMPVTSDEITYVQDLLEGSKLRTRDFVRTKHGDESHLELRASGTPEAHRAFMSMLYEADDVSAYDVI